ncbi:MAG TPA: ABC-2 family transporter protein [Polyangia bacterium]|nr:ABC-2 family transporter protein [Polyangia bacterium]
MRRYARLLRVQMTMSALTAMQYRADFIVRGFIATLWMAVTLAPIVIVFGARQTVAGWTFPESLVVVGWFTLLHAVLEGAVSPSLTAVVEHVRRGTLDFVLLKPADAQFLVSTAKLEPWHVVDVAGALIIFLVAFTKLGRWPSLPQVATGVALLGLAIVILYSIWILVISASFWVVKVDNLSYLFGSLFDAARWPISVFRGALRIVFTFVFPIALLTTYPALALLGRLDARTALAAFGGGLAFAGLARWVWHRALGLYTSASS